jgi:hypothetical protein
MIAVDELRDCIGNFHVMKMDWMGLYDCDDICTSSFELPSNCDQISK